MSNTFPLGHALLIGVGGADLPRTVDDAVGLERLLKDPERCAYPSSQVHLLTGIGATRQSILEALDSLAKQATSESTVVIYFSGHGYGVKASTGETYYMLPHGYDLNKLYKTAIQGQDFTAKLAAIPAQKLLVLLDCCHAGGVGEAKAAGLELTKSPLPPDALQLFSEGTGRVLIASSKEDEISLAGRPYSAFTLALIEALCGKGAARQDGYVRVADLAMYAREMVPQRTKNRQHPILHFEHADNFTLAYYAGGDAQPKGLPFTVEPEIEPEPGAWNAPFTQQTAIVIGKGTVVQGNGNTVIGAGGVMVGGSVKGDIVTGTKISQKAGDDAIQIGQARDVDIKR